MASRSFSSSAPIGWRVGGKVVSPPQLAWTGYVLTLCFYAWLFSMWQVEPVPLEVHVLGVLVAALCLVPITLWMARGNRDIPAFELICIAYLFAYSLPLYLQPNSIIILSEPVHFTWDETYSALVMVCVGLIAFIGGHYLLAQSRLTFAALQIDLPLHPLKRLTFVRIAFLVGFSILIARVSMGFSAGSLSSVVTVVQNLVNVAIVLLAYRVFRGQESKGWTVTLYLAVVAAALIGLASGMLEYALVPLVLLVIVRWNVTRRPPWLLFAIGLFVFVTLNSMKMTFRAQTWQGHTNLSMTQKLGVWMDLLTGTTPNTKGTKAKSESGWQDTFRTSMQRFDLLHGFLRVQQLTPSQLPFYEGQTYGFLFYGWVPRFIWPDKPIAQEANVQFAVDYGFLSEEQTATTMIGIGHLPEAYANFGFWGIVTIMALQGMFLAIVGKMLNGEHSEGGRAIYLSVMVFFLNGIGSATASLFMSIPLTVIVAGLILRACALNWRATPQTLQQARTLGR